MKTTKQILSILLLIAMILTAAACGSGGDKKTVISDTTAAETAAEEEGEKEIPDDLPAADFEGYVFRIGVTNVNSLDKQVIVETETGDVVDDAVYTSNVMVEERFNVDLKALIVAEATDVNIVKAAVLAGEDAYDLFTSHDISMGNVALEGIFRNVRALPYLDFSKPWWPEHTVDSLTVNDCMVLFANYNSYDNLYQTRATFVNMDIIADYGMDMPYGMVDDGSWTLDALFGMAENVYDDVNGNAERDEEDIYGMSTTHSMYATQESFGITPIIKDEEGRLIFDIYNEKTITLVEKFYRFLFETQGGHVRKTDLNKMFVAGKSMTLFTPLSICTTALRDTEVDYGILPMPKFDEAQDGYISGSTARPFGVPLTAQNDERLGIITEAMSAYGYKIIRPAYFEIALKDKYSYDIDSKRMLTIIGDNIILDFSYIFSNYGGFSWTLMKMMENKTTDFASWYDTNYPAAQKQLEKVQAYFDRLADEM